MSTTIGHDDNCLCVRSQTGEVRRERRGRQAHPAVRTAHKKEERSHYSLHEVVVQTFEPRAEFAQTRSGRMARNTVSESIGPGTLERPGSGRTWLKQWGERQQPLPRRRGCNMQLQSQLQLQVLHNMLKHSNNT
jgi:hypothetical protein